MSRATDRRLVALARKGGGVLEPAEAVKILERPDAVEHLIAGGLWQEALPGVLVPAASVVTREVRENSVRWWDDKAMLSHFSAARREGIWVPDNDDAWVTVDITSTKRDVKGLRVIRSRAFDITPRTDGRHRWVPPDRTIVDLASFLTRNQLDAVMLNAIRQKKASAAQVRAAAQPVRTRPGISQLLELAELWTPERETVLEGRLHEDVLSVVPCGVQRQLSIESPGRRRTARVDVAIPELRLIFEADGLYYHSTDAQIAADQLRDRWLAAMGWQTIRFREGF
ncbi:MAG: hypothetical protein JWO22_3513 [Frankiales bacterium]|nr:hypothetical protein [Frankiales bacterium]